MNVKFWDIRKSEKDPVNNYKIFEYDSAKL